MVYNHPTILIVDDDEAICGLVCEGLAEYGYTFDVASTANDALGKLHVVMQGSEVSRGPGKLDYGGEGKGLFYEWRYLAAYPNIFVEDLLSGHPSPQ